MMNGFKKVETIQGWDNATQGQRLFTHWEERPV